MAVDKKNMYTNIHTYIHRIAHAYIQMCRKIFKFCISARTNFLITLPFLSSTINNLNLMKLHSFSNSNVFAKDLSAAPTEKHLLLLFSWNSYYLIMSIGLRKFDGDKFFWFTNCISISKLKLVWLICCRHYTAKSLEKFRCIKRKKTQFFVGKYLDGRKHLKDKLFICQGIDNLCEILFSDFFPLFSGFSGFIGFETKIGGDTKIFIHFS